MFYKHTHLLFLSLSLFFNSQILRSNKQTQSQQPCPPPHLPQFSQSQTPPPPPPITTPAPPMVQARWQACPAPLVVQACQPKPRGLGRMAQAVVKVYFFIFGFPIRLIFILDFILGFFGTLEVWERRVGEELGLGL